MRQIRERLGRKRDTYGRLVGAGVTRAADWGGRWVRRSPREGQGNPKEVLCGDLKTVIFVFVGSEFVNGLMKY